MKHASADKKRFLALPKPIRLMIAFSLILALTTAGIFFLYMLDGIFLDFDPLGKLVGLVFAKK